MHKIVVEQRGLFRRTTRKQQYLILPCLVSASTYYLGNVHTPRPEVTSSAADYKNIKPTKAARVALATATFEAEVSVGASICAGTSSVLMQ